MSAFIVSKAHIDALVRLADEGPTDQAGGPWEYDGRDKTRVGRVLWLENLRSVAARYPYDTSGTRPGPIDLSDAEIAAYEYTTGRPLTCVEALKALTCYEYQSCETDDWQQTDAHELCEGLRRAVIRALPGYGEAAWEIDD